MLWWLVFAMAWTAVAVVAGVVLGAAVRKADQLASADPYAGLLTDPRWPVAR